MDKRENVIKGLKACIKGDCRENACPYALENECRKSLERDALELLKAQEPSAPAVPLDEDLQTIMICAVRYALGRQTYMPGLVTDWIMNNCAGKLYKGRIEIMLRDIQEQREMGERANYNSLGDPCDVRTWEKFEAWLSEQMKGASDE